MNHLQLQQAALPDLSESQISRLPKDQLAHFSNAVQQLHDWTLQMRGRINRGMEIRYADQIRHAATLGQEEAARFRIDDGDLQIDVSQPKEIVWDQQHLSQIAERMVVAGDRVQDFMQVQFSVRSRTTPAGTHCCARHFSPPARNSSPSPPSRSAG